MFWHMVMRQPWTWLLGPSNSSERTHVIELLRTETLPKNAMLCGDAGFVGYPLWSAIREREHHFLVRVGANVSLLHEHADFQRVEVGKDGEILCWPKAARVAGQPPLRLRLLKVRLGQLAVWMLTSVLDPKQLTPQQVVRLYKMRWGIEGEFRGLKQTLERGKVT